MNDSLTIPRLLRRSVERHGARTALQWVDETGAVASMTFASLAGEVETLASALLSRGARRGRRVALIADNGPEWTIGYLAILEAGATAVPLDPAEPNVSGLLVAAGALGVLTGRRLARPGEPGPPPAPEIPDDVFRIDLIERDASRGQRIDAEVAEPADVASLLFTSGTTGSPRAVPLTHRALLAECEALSEIATIRPGDRTLALVPLFHILGFNTGLMLPLRHGATIGFLPVLDRATLLDAMRRHRPTHLCAVPAVWEALRLGIETQIARRPAPLRLLPRRLMRPVHRALGGALHTLVTSGAPISDETVAFWKSFGFEVLHAYGLTETSGAVTCTRPGDPPGAGVGRPLRGVEIRIDDNGEILARGEVVMSGYEGGGEATADTGATRFDGGWLRTGDLGRIDGRGNLHVLGRAREAIVRRGGETVYPEPVEEALARAEFVAEVAVVGSGPVGDQRPVAVVVPDREAMARRGVLDVFGSVRYSLLSRAATLPAAWRPASYRIVPEALPRTPTRKLRRAEVRQRLARGAYGWGADAMTSRERPGHAAIDLGDDRVARAVGAALAGVVRDPSARVGPSLSLGADLGIDSLDRVNLACSIESALGVRLGETAIQAATVGDLMAAVREAAPGRGSAPGEVFSPSPGDDDGVLGEAERTARRLRFARRLMLGVFRGVATVGFDVRVEGLERLPRQGPFMLCSNHQSYLDPYFLIPALPAEVRERLWIVAVDWLFRGPLSRTYLYTARTLPMDNLGRFLPGMRMAARVLERGEGLLIFPEGMRSFDGRVGPWRPGAGMIVQRVPVPMVPIAIAGIYQVLPPGRVWPRLRDPAGGRRRVRVAIGEPVMPRPPRPGEDAAVTAQREMDRMRERVMDLMESFPAEIRPGDLEPALVSVRAGGGTA